MAFEQAARQVKGRPWEPGGDAPRPAGVEVTRMGAATARAPACGPRSVGHAMGRGRFLMCAPEMELPGPRLFRAGEEASRPVSMVSASPEPARPPPQPLSGADTRPSHALQVVRRDMKSVFYIWPNVERSYGGARVHRRRRVGRVSRRSRVQWRALWHAVSMGATRVACRGGVRRMWRARWGAPLWIRFSIVWSPCTI